MVYANTMQVSADMLMVFVIRRQVMKKILRNVLLTAMSIFYVSFLLTGAARAEANNDNRVAFHIQVPSEWEAPCAWAWNEDGTNAFESWPGEELEADELNADWYYIWLPEFANHIIINANSGTVQTEEIIVDAGKESWIQIADDGSVTLLYEAQTVGELREYTAKFEVHAKVDGSWSNPGIWAWSAPDGKNAFESWPGEEMVYSDETGWYTAKVPEWVNSIIINANNGEIQTEDISIDPAEVWVTVDADGKMEYSYIDPDKASVANVKIYVKAPADWNEPCLWAWSAPDGTNVFSNWPGEGFEEDSSGWLVKEIPGWVNSVIVNGNEGSVQTQDISVEAGKDIWLIVNGAEDVQLSYEPIEVSDTQSDAEPVTVDEVAKENVSDTKDSKAVPIAVGGGLIVLAAVGTGVAVSKRKKAS